MNTRAFSKTHYVFRMLNINLELTRNNNNKKMLFGYRIQMVGRIFSVWTSLSSSSQRAPIGIPSFSRDKKVGKHTPFGKPGRPSSNRVYHWGNRVPHSESWFSISGDRWWPIFPISGDFGLKLKNLKTWQVLSQFSIKDGKQQFCIPFLSEHLRKKLQKKNISLEYQIWPRHIIDRVSLCCYL